MAADAANLTDRSTDDPPSALADLWSHVRFWLTAAIVLFLDLWSKHWAFSELGPSEIRPIIPGVLDFRRSLNDGAVFGSFTGYTQLFIVASLFALGFVLYLFAHSGRGHRAMHIALGLILAGALGNLYDRAYIHADVVRVRSRTGEEVPHIGTIVGDTESDRIRIGDWPSGTNVREYRRDDATVRRQGVVRDFIRFVPEFPSWVPRLAGKDVWPWVFNSADAALVCGVLLLLVHTWIDRKSDALNE
jgi:lipoprotein signal peptidase